MPHLGCCGEPLPIGIPPIAPNTSANQTLLIWFEFWISSRLPVLLGSSHALHAGQKWIFGLERSLLEVFDRLPRQQRPKSERFLPFFGPWSCQVFDKRPLLWVS